MFIDLTKRMKLKKISQSAQSKIIFNQQQKTISRLQSEKLFNQQQKTIFRFRQQSKTIFNQSSKVIRHLFNNDITKNNFNLFFKKIYIDVVFELNDELLYHIIDDNHRRFCISTTCETNIFRITHDENQHVDRHRCYQNITNIMYVSRLFKKFRFYLKHCFNCQLNQIKRHKFYEKLIFIFNSSKSFHIIIMNFVINLFDEFDVLFTMTNKFSRRCLLIVDKFIYNIEE